MVYHYKTLVPENHVSEAIFLFDLSLYTFIAS